MKQLLLLLCIACVAGCASLPNSLETYLERTPKVPSVVELDGVPFLKQKRNHCGPAALAIAMNRLGKKIDPDQLADKIFTPQSEGSFQEDLIGASRREGLLAVPIQGYERLFEEIAAGNPVIVFENLRVSWWPVWHYAIVFGYDLKKKTVTLHSGSDEHDTISFKSFEKDWSRGDYWGLVILSPHDPGAAKSEMDLLKAAAGIERVGRLDDALTAYQTILRRWPNSLGALVGTANILDAKERPFDSARSLERARAIAPKNAAVWHNLAIAYSKMGAKRSAQATAQRALKLVSAKDLPAYRENLVPLTKP